MRIKAASVREAISTSRDDEIVPSFWKCFKRASEGARAVAKFLCALRAREKKRLGDYLPPRQGPPGPRKGAAAPLNPAYSRSCNSPGEGAKAGFVTPGLAGSCHY